MNKAFPFVELIVFIAIIAIITVMLISAIRLVYKKTNLAEQGTQDTWKTSGNMTPSGAVQTYIITDPTNNQKWIVVTRGSQNVSNIIYIPPPITPEANK